MYELSHAIRTFIIWIFIISITGIPCNVRADENHDVLAAVHDAEIVRNATERKPPDPLNNGGMGIVHEMNPPEPVGLIASPHSSIDNNNQVNNLLQLNVLPGTPTSSSNDYLMSTNYDSTGSQSSSSQQSSGHSSGSQNKTPQMHNDSYQSVMNSQNENIHMSTGIQHSVHQSTPDNNNNHMSYETSGTNGLSPPKDHMDPQHVVSQTNSEGKLSSQVPQSDLHQSQYATQNMDSESKTEMHQSMATSQQSQNDPQYQSSHHSAGADTSGTLSQFNPESQGSYAVTGMHTTSQLSQYSPQTESSLVPMEEETSTRLSQVDPQSGDSYASTGVDNYQQSSSGAQYTTKDDRSRLVNPTQHESSDAQYLVSHTSGDLTSQLQQSDANTQTSGSYTSNDAQTPSQQLSFEPKAHLSDVPDLPQQPQSSSYAETETMTNSEFSPSDPQFRGSLSSTGDKNTVYESQSGPELLIESEAAINSQSDLVSSGAKAQTDSHLQRSQRAAGMETNGEQSHQQGSDSYTSTGTQPMSQDSHPVMTQNQTPQSSTESKASMSSQLDSGLTSHAGPHISSQSQPLYAGTQADSQQEISQTATGTETISNEAQSSQTSSSSYTQTGTQPASNQPPVSQHQMSQPSTRSEAPVGSPSDTQHSGSSSHTEPQTSSQVSQTKPHYSGTLTSSGTHTDSQLVQSGSQNQASQMVTGTEISSNGTQLGHTSSGSYTHTGTQPASNQSPESQDQMPQLSTGSETPISSISETQHSGSYSHTGTQVSQSEPEYQGINTASQQQKSHTAIGTETTLTESQSGQTGTLSHSYSHSSSQQSQPGTKSEMPQTQKISEITGTETTSNEAQSNQHSSGQNMQSGTQSSSHLSQQDSQYQMPQTQKQSKAPLNSQTGTQYQSAHQTSTGTGITSVVTDPQYPGTPTSSHLLQSEIQHQSSSVKTDTPMSSLPNSDKSVYTSNEPQMSSQTNPQYSSSSPSSGGRMSSQQLSEFQYMGSENTAGSGTISEKIQPVQHNPDSTEGMQVAGGSILSKTQYGHNSGTASDSGYQNPQTSVRSDSSPQYPETQHSSGIKQHDSSPLTSPGTQMQSNVQYSDTGTVTGTETVPQEAQYNKQNSKSYSQAEAQSPSAYRYQSSQVAAGPDSSQLSQNHGTQTGIYMSSENSNLDPQYSATLTQSGIHTSSGMQTSGPHNSGTITSSGAGQTTSQEVQSETQYPGTISQSEPQYAGTLTQSGIQSQQGHSNMQYPATMSQAGPQYAGTLTSSGTQPQPGGSDTMHIAKQTATDIETASQNSGTHTSPVMSQSNPQNPSTVTQTGTHISTGMQPSEAMYSGTIGSPSGGQTTSKEVQSETQYPGTMLHSDSQYPGTITSSGTQSQPGPSDMQYTGTQRVTGMQQSGPGYTGTVTSSGTQPQREQPDTQYQGTMTQPDPQYSRKVTSGKQSQEGRSHTQIQGTQTDNSIQPSGELYPGTITSSGTENAVQPSGELYSGKITSSGTENGMQPSGELYSGTISSSGTDNGMQPSGEHYSGTIASSGTDNGMQLSGELYSGTISSSGTENGMKPSGEHYSGTIASSGSDNGMQPSGEHYPGKITSSGTENGMQPSGELYPGTISSSGTENGMQPSGELYPGAITSAGTENGMQPSGELYSGTISSSGTDNGMQPSGEHYPGKITSSGTENGMQPSGELYSGTISSSGTENGMQPSGEHYPEKITSAGTDNGMKPSGELYPGTITSSGTENGMQPSGELYSGTISSSGTENGMQPSAEHYPGKITSAGTDNGMKPSGKLYSGAIASAGTENGMQPSGELYPGKITSSGTENGMQPSGELYSGTISSSGTDNGMQPSGEHYPGKITSSGTENGMQPSGELYPEKITSSGTENGMQPSGELYSGTISSSGTDNGMQPSGEHYPGKITSSGTENGMQPSGELYSGTISSSGTENGMQPSGEYYPGKITSAGTDNGMKPSGELYSGAITSSRTENGMKPSGELYPGAITSSGTDNGMQPSGELYPGAITSSGTDNGIQPSGELYPGKITSSGTDNGIQPSGELYPGAITSSGTDNGMQPSGELYPGAITSSGTDNGMQPSGELYPGKITSSGTDNGMQPSGELYPGKITSSGTDNGIQPPGELHPGAITSSGIENGMQPSGEHYPGKLTSSGTDNGMQPPGETVSPGEYKSSHTGLNSSLDPQTNPQHPGTKTETQYPGTVTQTGTHTSGMQPSDPLYPGTIALSPPKTTSTEVQSDTKYPDTISQSGPQYPEITISSSGTQPQQERPDPGTISQSDPLYPGTLTSSGTQPRQVDTQYPSTISQSGPQYPEITISSSGTQLQPGRPDPGTISHSDPQYPGSLTSSGTQPRQSDTQYPGTISQSGPQYPEITISSSGTQPLPGQSDQGTISQSDPQYPGSLTSSGTQLQQGQSDTQYPGTQTAADMQPSGLQYPGITISSSGTQPQERQPDPGTILQSDPQYPGTLTSSGTQPRQVDSQYPGTISQSGPQYPEITISSSGTQPQPGQPDLGTISHSDPQYPGSLTSSGTQPRQVDTKYPGTISQSGPQYPEITISSSGTQPQPGQSDPGTISQSDPQYPGSLTSSGTQPRQVDTKYPGTISQSGPQYPEITISSSGTQPQPGQSDLGTISQSDPQYPGSLTSSGIQPQQGQSDMPFPGTQTATDMQPSGLQYPGITISSSGTQPDPGTISQSDPQYSGTSGIQPQPGQSDTQYPGTISQSGPQYPEISMSSGTQPQEGQPDPGTISQSDPQYPGILTSSGTQTQPGQSDMQYPGTISQSGPQYPEIAISSSGTKPQSEQPDSGTISQSDLQYPGISISSGTQPLQVDTQYPGTISQSGPQYPQVSISSGTQPQEGQSDPGTISQSDPQYPGISISSGTQPLQVDTQYPGTISQSGPQYPQVSISSGTQPQEGQPDPGTISQSDPQYPGISISSGTQPLQVDTQYPGTISQSGPQYPQVSISSGTQPQGGQSNPGTISQSDPQYPGISISSGTQPLQVDTQYPGTISQSGPQYPQVSISSGTQPQEGQPDPGTISQSDPQYPGISISSGTQPLQVDTQYPGTISQSGPQYPQVSISSGTQPQEGQPDPGTISQSDPQYPGISISSGTQPLQVDTQYPGTISQSGPQYPQVSISSGTQPQEGQPDPGTISQSDPQYPGILTSFGTQPRQGQVDTPYPGTISQYPGITLSSSGTQPQPGQPDPGIISQSDQQYPGTIASSGTQPQEGQPDQQLPFQLGTISQHPQPYPQYVASQTPSETLSSQKLQSGSQTNSFPQIPSSSHQDSPQLSPFNTPISQTSTGSGSSQQQPQPDMSYPQIGVQTLPQTQQQQPQPDMSYPKVGVQTLPQTQQQQPQPDMSYPKVGIQTLPSQYPTLNSSDQKSQNPTAVPNVGTEAGCGKFIDMIIVVDGPADYVQFKTLQAALLKFVDNMQLAIDKVRLGFIIQSGSYKTTSVGLSSNAANLRTALSKLQMPSDGKRTDLAIKEMKVMFRSSSRESSTRVGVVIINGNSQYPTQTAKRSAFARHDGIIMFAVGVGKNIDRSELKSIATFLTPIFEPETYTDLFYSVESYSKVFCVTPQQYGLQATIVLQGPETTETSSAETSTDQTPTVTTPATQTAHPELLRVCRDFINSHGPGYINHHTDCNKYIKCSMSTGGNVRADVKVCSLGKFWSTTTSRCEDSSKVECMQDPCVYARGMVSSYANPDNCRAFWKCGENTTPKCCAANQKYMRGQGCVTDYDGTCNMLCSLNDQSAGASPTVQRAPSKVPESSDLTTSANQANCMKRPDSVDKTKYEVYVGSMVWKKESCEVGTEYSQDLCICTPVKSAYTPVVSNISPTVSEVIEPDVTKVSKTGCNRRADPMDKTQYLEYTTSGWVKETCKMGSEYNDAMCDCSINPTPMGYPSGQPSVTYGLHSPPVVTQSEIPKSSAPSACDKMVVSLDHSKYGVHDSLSGYQEKSCPLGREFDPKTCLCSTVRHGQLPTTPIDLAQVCSSKLRHISGYIGDPTDSTKYIKCSLQPDQTYIASSEKCLFGKFWDEPSMSCLDSHITKSAYDPCVIAEGMITSYSYRENCRAYFQCGQSTHVMCCDVGMKYVEERGCVTDTDNSCRQDCPPKTIGNNAGCMKRPHAMDRYKYEEYMGVLGWQIKPCDTGEEYSQEACNCSPVKQILSHSPVCNRRAVTTDKTRYEEYMAVYGWQMRTCATGEVYNDVICRCTQISTSQQPSSAEQPNNPYEPAATLIGTLPGGTKISYDLEQPSQSLSFGPQLSLGAIQPKDNPAQIDLTHQFLTAMDASKPADKPSQVDLTYGSLTSFDGTQPKDQTQPDLTYGSLTPLVGSQPKEQPKEPTIAYRSPTTSLGSQPEVTKMSTPIDYAQECATKMHLSSGYLPDPTDSTKYIKCTLQPDHTYIASSISCTFGQVWDAPSMSCLDSSITSNPTEQQKEPSLTYGSPTTSGVSQPDVTKISTANACDKTVVSSDPSKYGVQDPVLGYREKSCPFGREFSQYTCLCSTVKYGRPPSHIDYAQECATKMQLSSGYLPDPTDSTKYIKCSLQPDHTYIASSISCTFGKFWDVPSMSCLDSHITSNPYDLCVIAEGMITSYSYRENCRAYFQCGQSTHVMCCDAGMKYVEERGCVTDTDNSCRQDCPPKTTGNKISGCDKRPNTLDNTKYEVYIVSRGWQPMSCDPGTEYNQEVCSCSPVKLSYTPGTSGCDKRPNTLDATKYEVYIVSHGWQPRSCDPGTEYNQEACACSPVKLSYTPGTSGCDKRPYTLDNTKYEVYIVSRGWQLMPCAPGTEYSQEACGCAPMKLSHTLGTSGCNKKAVAYDSVLYEEYVDYVGWQEHACNQGYHYVHELCNCAPTGSATAPSSNTKVCDKKPVDTDKGKYLMADSTGTYMERRCPTGKEFDPNTCLCSIIVPYPVNTTVDIKGLCDSIPYKDVGLTGYPLDSTKYVKCDPQPDNTFLASEMSCPFGKMWQQESLSCQDSHLVRNKFDPCVYAEGMISSYAYSGNCRAYMSCESATFVKCCDPGTKFVDGKGCVNDTDFSCMNSCPPETISLHLPDCMFKAVAGSKTNYEEFMGAYGWEMRTCDPGTEYSDSMCACVQSSTSQSPTAATVCNRQQDSFDRRKYREYFNLIGWVDKTCDTGYEYNHKICDCSPAARDNKPGVTSGCNKRSVDTDRTWYEVYIGSMGWVQQPCPAGEEYSSMICDCSRNVVPFGCTKRPFRGDITKYQEREGTKWVDRSCEPSHLYNNDMCQCSPIHTFIASTGNFDLNRVCVLSEMEHGAGFSSHPSDCTKYLRCTVQLDKSILAEVMECPFKQFWDQSILSCVESHKVYCKQDPCVISNGRITSYGNADNCRSYWECGRRTRGKCCAGGHMYKEGVGCVPDLNNMCGTSCPPKVKKNNFECDKRTYSRDTSRYEQMMQGFGYVKLRCAPGTLFDQPTCGCSKYAPYNSPTELNKEESRIACQGCKMSNGAGFNNHPYDCTRYVQCFQQPDSSFRAKFRDCPYGMFWDQDILSCQESHRVKCATDPCMLIKGKKRYADADNCKGYWECTPDGTYPLCCAEGKVYLEGRGCIRDKTKLCNNTCPPEDVYATEKCHKKAIPNNKQKYIQWIKGHGDIEMDCPYGTEYSTFNCLCITITSIASHAGRPDTVKAPKMCEADLRLEFNNGLHDSSGKWTYVNNQGVTFDNGTAYFDGKSRLLIPQYTNADFGNTFVMRIRYKGTGIYAEPGSLQALINNGDCGDDGTVQIFTSQKEIGFSVKTKPRTDKVSFKVPKPATEWKNVEYEFINNRLEGKVNGVSGGVGWSEGDIEARHCALQIGFGFGYQNFVGYVDTLEVYRCKPETPMVWI